jgi:hypothetical protein
MAIAAVELAPTAADIDRLFKMVEKTEGCWLFTGSVNNRGYGQFRLDGSPRLAHRVVYTFYCGPIPLGLTLDHLCEIRRCVRPRHLEPVPLRTNLLRSNGASAGNSRKTTCPSGHPYDDANTCLSGGKRYCRACARAKMARRARQAVA